MADQTLNQYQSIPTGPLQPPFSPQTIMPEPTQPAPTTDPVATGTPQQTGANAYQTAQSGALTMPQSGSVVDLLNMAGMDSSQASRQQLAQQYGIEGYDFSAAKNTELANKFLEAYNANKNKTAPTSGAEASTMLDQYFQDNKPMEQEDPKKSFMDQYAAMNPIEANLFQQLSQIASSTMNQQSLTELWQEAGKEFDKMSGVEMPNLELADLNRIMEGTEDDIRAEITAAGGFATESQVQALTSARNKTLLRRANYLQNVLNAKNDYVDRIVSLTQADRKAVSEELDRKLGITEQLVSMANRMTDVSRENYRSIIKDVGYDGLISSITSPEELSAVAKSLGMTPRSLLQMASIKTDAQKDQELAMMNYQLSVDKFNEDKRQFGLQYALEVQKNENKNAASNIVTPYRIQQTQLIGEKVADLVKDLDTKMVAGYASYLAYLPKTEAKYFANKLDSLKSNIFQTALTAMREASKTGGAVGNVSDREGARFEAALGALNTDLSPEQLKAELEKTADIMYSWTAQVMSIEKGFDYDGARNPDILNPETGKPYTNEEIFNYVNSL